MWSFKKHLKISKKFNKVLKNFNHFYFKRNYNPVFDAGNLKYQKLKTS